MVAAGYSPSVRLFEAAACATPIVSDYWDGIETLFAPGEEILIARSSAEALELVRDLSEADRLAIGERARSRVLSEHTAAHRAAELEGYALEVLSHQPSWGAHG
jgi:spore maturation protein CgeB